MQANMKNTKLLYKTEVEGLKEKYTQSFYWLNWDSVVLTEGDWYYSYVLAIYVLLLL